MADLGNLYFDILFRDKTAEQRKKLKAEITKDLQAKLDVGFDKKKLVGDMKTLLQSEKFKINVVVDKASTTQAVRAALQAAGLNTNFTASDLRAAKAAAIQTKAEASAAAARELARQRAARAAKAELDLANARERSANAARRHMTATLNMNGAMNSQLSIVGQLRMNFWGYTPFMQHRTFCVQWLILVVSWKIRKLQWPLFCKMKAKLQPYSIKLRNWLLLLHSGLWI